MITNWKSISFESNTINQGCTFLSFNKSQNKHSRQTSLDKKEILTPKKNKIKCPQSKHLRQQSQHLKTLEKKNISFSKTKQVQNTTISFKNLSTNTKNPKIWLLPPMQKNKTKSFYQPLSKFIDSSRSEKALIRSESKSTKHILQFRQNIQTTHQQKQDSHRDICCLKTLEEFSPKVAVSVIDPTFCGSIPIMEQSKIVIDFFNLPEQNLLQRQDQWANIS